MEAEMLYSSVCGIDIAVVSSWTTSYQNLRVMQSKVSTPKTKALLDALKGLGVDVSKQHVLMIVDELTDAIQR